MLAHESQKELSEINVTPFIDVMLVLLIIFMVVTPLVTSSVKVELPQTASSVSEEEKSPIIIYINEKNEIFDGEHKISEDKIGKALDQKTGSDKNRVIYFYVDRVVSYERLMSVIQRVKSENYLKIALASVVKGAD